MARLTILETVDGIGYCFDRKKFIVCVDEYVKKRKEKETFTKAMLYEEIANTTCVSVDAIKKWRSGKNGPQDIERIKEIAKVLEVDYKELLRASDESREKIMMDSLMNEAMFGGFNQGINFNTLRFLDMLNKLAEMTKHGFIAFDEVSTDEDCEKVMYDNSKEDYAGYRIVMDCVIDECHHDIVSDYDSYCCGGYKARVEFDDDDIPYIEIQTDDSNTWFVVENGRWYCC